MCHYCLCALLPSLLLSVLVIIPRSLHCSMTATESKVEQFVRVIAPPCFCATSALRPHSCGFISSLQACVCHVVCARLLLAQGSNRLSIISFVWKNAQLSSQATVTHVGKCYPSISSVCSSVGWVLWQERVVGQSLSDNRHQTDALTQRAEVFTEEKTPHDARPKQLPWVLPLRHDIFSPHSRKCHIKNLEHIFRLATIRKVEPKMKMILCCLSDNI